jgi:glutaredoxin-like protein NrdH
MVTIYGKPGCVKCDRTKKSASKLGLDFEYKDITVDERAYARVIELGYQMLPVVEANGQHWSDYQPDKLASLK